MPERLHSILEHILAAWEPHIMRVLEFLPIAALAVFARFVVCWHGRQCHTWRGWLLECCVAVLSALVVDAVLQYFVQPMSLRVAAAGISGVSGMRLLYALSDRAYTLAKGQDERS